MRVFVKGKNYPGLTISRCLGDFKSKDYGVFANLLLLNIIWMNFINKDNENNINNQNMIINNNNISINPDEYQNLIYNILNSKKLEFSPNYERYENGLTINNAKISENNKSILLNWIKLPNIHL